MIKGRLRLPELQGVRCYGGRARCKVLIDEDGTIAELNSGAQLCETVPWSQFRYQPTVKGAHAVRVNTEVEVRFDPRK